MRKILKWLTALLFFGLIVLFIFNYRYPFITPAVGNWSVGYGKTNKILPSFSINPNSIITYKEVDSLLVEEIHYIADPFFVADSTGYYLFTELKGNGSADIALFTSHDGSEYNYQGVVLDESFHLSYPQVFNYKNEYYMVPETKGAGNVLLYKAKEFPFEWEIEDTLLHNIAIKDPSILLSKDLNLIVGVNDNLEQFFFTADSLKGSWKEHPNYSPRWGNESRPGGRFFKVNDSWYLPLQNRRLGYGTGISLYALKNNQGNLELIPKRHMYLSPQTGINWFNRGMHHLDIQPDKDSYYVVYDGDRNFKGKRSFQYKRTLKFNFIDLYNYFRN
ncbi:glucosamine inositolphosphorylceramide transferase family protein [Salegentibacter chungangensis]|uniref:Glucosamine inositolphosphorylceramide transferase 1 N-terminal domain-containing protein n=1 Tax=Salegentibacter chungangensis TaxID=1335724 RepID=A0ABW3NS56_9FLAO